MWLAPNQGWWAAAAGAVAGWRAAYGPLPRVRAGQVLGLTLAGRPAPGGLAVWCGVSGCVGGPGGVAGVEAAVAECPAAQAVAGVLGQGGGRDGEHGAVGVG